MVIDPPADNNRRVECSRSPLDRVRCVSTSLAAADTWSASLQRKPLPPHPGESLLRLTPAKAFSAPPQRTPSAPHPSESLLRLTPAKAGGSRFLFHHLIEGSRRTRDDEAISAIVGQNRLWFCQIELAQLLLNLLAEQRACTRDSRVLAYGLELRKNVTELSLCGE